MGDLKTHADSLNIKGKGGDNTVPFTNCTNSDLQRHSQRQNWLWLVGDIYARPEPAGTYDMNTQFSYHLQKHIVLSMEQGDTE